LKWLYGLIESVEPSVGTILAGSLTLDMNCLEDASCKILCPYCGTEHAHEIGQNVEYDPKIRDKFLLETELEEVLRPYIWRRGEMATEIDLTAEELRVLGKFFEKTQNQCKKCLEYCTEPKPQTRFEIA